MSNSLAFGRMWQLPISALCLAVPISVVLLASRELGVSGLLPLAVYCIYTASAAAILTMIAHRLYVMHCVRRFVFDIAIWFMVVALLALPLGAARVFANWIATLNTGLDARHIQTMRSALAACFYLELVPVFFLTEGLVSLSALVVRKLKIWRVAKPR
ncbi:MAG: hypothetical protein ACTHK7_03505 [Aureliella sp.]